jgi:hypothetical protein
MYEGHGLEYKEDESIKRPGDKDEETGEYDWPEEHWENYTDRFTDKFGTNVPLD